MGVIVTDVMDPGWILGIFLVFRLSQPLPFGNVTDALARSAQGRPRNVDFSEQTKSKKFRRGVCLSQQARKACTNLDSTPPSCKALVQL